MSPSARRPLFCVGLTALALAPQAYADGCAQAYEKAFPYTRAINADQTQIDLRNTVTLRYDCKAVSAESVGGIDADLFGNKVQLIGASAVAQATPAKLHLTASALVLGYEIARSDQDVTELYHQVFKPDQDLDVAQIQMVTIGPVVIPVRYGLQGTAGFEITARVANLGVQLEATPAAKVNAYVQAEAGVEMLKTSARGQLLLIDGHLNNTIGIQFSPKASGQTPTIDVKVHGKSDVNALDGSVVAHLEVPDNGTTKSYDQDLLRWPGYKGADDLYDHQEKIADLPAPFTADQPAAVPLPELSPRSGAAGPISAAAAREAGLQIDRSVVIGLDEGQLLSAFAAQDGQSDLPQTLYLQLKAWMNLHPSSLKTFGSVASTLPETDLRLRSLVKAMTAVGSAEAQAALVALVDTKGFAPELQERLTTSLGFVQQPTPATTAALASLAASSPRASVKQRATLALGMAASHLRQSPATADQERADVIETQLVRGLVANRWSTSTQQLDTLAALGNLGPKQLGPLAASRDSSSVQARAAAYMALRFAPDPAALELLVKGYKAEDQRPAAERALVRQAILQALSLRPADAATTAAINALLP